MQRALLLTVALLVVAPAAAVGDGSPYSVGVSIGPGVTLDGGVRDVMDTPLGWRVTCRKHIDPDYAVDIDFAYELSGGRKEFVNGGIGSVNLYLYQCELHTLSLLPSVSRRVGSKDNWALRLGLGMGISRRILKLYLWDYRIDIVGARETYAMHYLSLPFLAKAGLSRMLSDRISATAELRFLHHYLLTDEDSGDIGNTGGLAFDIGLALRL